MKEQLCRECQPSGSCFLKEVVDSVVKNIPPFEKQTRLPGTDISVQIIEAENTIGYYKKAAGEMLKCPNINSINPISSRNSNL